MAIARAELGDDASVDHERLAAAVAEPLRRDEGREVFPGVVPKAAALLLALLRTAPLRSRQRQGGAAGDHRLPESQRA